MSDLMHTMKVDAVLEPHWSKRRDMWKVRVWDHENPTDTKTYTITATSDNLAANEGIRRFLAEHAPVEGTVADVRSDGA